MFGTMVRILDRLSPGVYRSQVLFSSPLPRRLCLYRSHRRSLGLHRSQVPIHHPVSSFACPKV